MAFASDAHDVGSCILSPASMRSAFPLPSALITLRVPIASCLLSGEGVAHAPDVAHCCKPPRSQRHGRHKAPPDAPRRSRSLAKTSTNRSEVTTFMPPRVSTESRAPRRGNTAPESVFPLFFVNRSPTVRDPGVGTRVCGGEWDCGYEGPCEPLRGSILTRVPPSSIDRSAPRSRSSRCASSALATMRTAPSESRS